MATFALAQNNTVIEFIEVMEKMTVVTRENGLQINRIQLNKPAARNLYRTMLETGFKKVDWQSKAQWVTVEDAEIYDATLLMSPADKATYRSDKNPR